MSCSKTVWTPKKAKKMTIKAKILKILKKIGLIAEVAGPVVVTVIDPPLGAAVGFGVKAIEEETAKK